MKQKIEEKIYEKYKPGNLLGSGARSDVYEVYDKSNGRKYAMKVSSDKKVLQREADIMSKISNNAFPRMFEYTEGAAGYLLMEYVEGYNLQDLLDAGMKFTLAEVVWIMEEVLNALAFLHKQTPQMIYGDLKPANVVIEASGAIRIVDMGSVVYSQEKEKSGKFRAGTYGYAAPEQFWPDMPPQPQWDVYAAGKMLGYLLTGHNPAFPPYQLEDFYRKNKFVPDSMKTVLDRCLAKSGQARYSDATLMKQHLQMAYDECKKKKWFHKKRRYEIEYKKCIWLSEYRRIF